MTPPHTFLTPGQRYTEPDGTPWRCDQQVTIVGVEWDALGFPRVTFRRPDGENLVAPAVQVEAAVAAGLLVPVAGAGWIARC